MQGECHWSGVRILSWADDPPHRLPAQEHVDKAGKDEESSIREVYVRVAVDGTAGPE
jgi:hypothetical protein